MSNTSLTVAPHVDKFALPLARAEDAGLDVGERLWKDSLHHLVRDAPQHLFLRPAVERLRARVPEDDAVVQIAHEDVREVERARLLLQTRRLCAQSGRARRDLSFQLFMRAAQLFDGAPAGGVHVVEPHGRAPDERDEEGEA